MSTFEVRVKFLVKKAPLILRVPRPVTDDAIEAAIAKATHRRGIYAVESTDDYAGIVMDFISGAYVGNFLIMPGSEQAATA